VLWPSRVPAALILSELGGGRNIWRERRARRATGKNRHALPTGASNRTPEKQRNDRRARRWLSCDVTANSSDTAPRAPVAAGADKVTLPGKYNARLLFKTAIIEQQRIRSPSYLQINQFSNAFDLNSSSSGRRIFTTWGGSASSIP
jgi:hypothetical protein